MERPVRPADLRPLSERSAQQIGTARNLIDQQRFTEAAIELERALRYDPNHPDIHRTLALLQWQAGNAERAKTHALRALEVNPDDAGAHYVLGRLASAGGDGAGAIQAFRLAQLCSNFELDSDLEALTHYHLAETLAQTGYLEASLGEYEAFERKMQSRSMPPTDSELAALIRANQNSAGEAKARILESLGRYSDAADALAPVVASGRPDEARSIRLAKLLQQAGRSPEALDVLRSTPADNDAAFALLIDIYESSGRPDEAVKDLRLRLASRPEDSRLLSKLAEMLVRLGRAGEARDELRKYLVKHPDEFVLRNQLIDLLIADSEWTEVLAECSSGVSAQVSRVEDYESRFRALANDTEAVGIILEANPPNEPTVSAYLRGLLAVTAKKDSQAEGLLQRAVSLDSDFVPGRVALAELYLRTYRYPEALAVAARRDEFAPEDSRLERILGQVQERLDDTEKAALHFKAAFQSDPGDSQAMLALARLQRRADDLLSAQRQLRVLLEGRPAHEEAREMLALLYLQEGKLDTAGEQFEEMKRRSTSPNAQMRAQAMLELLRDRDADAYRKKLRESMDTHGPDLATWLALADSYSEFEQEPAREAYLNALAMDPDNETAALGVMFADQRLLSYEQALDRFLQLLPRRPNRHAWRLGWGGSSWQQGVVELHLVLQDFSAAEAMARSQESRDDLDPQTRTRYRRAILESLRAAGRNEELIRQLKEWAEAPDDGKQWSQALADAYRRQEQPESALPIYESLAKADANDMSALADLVDGLSAAGRHDRSAQYVLDWLAEDPENDDALAALVAVLADQKRTEDAHDLVRNRILITRDRERFQDIQLVLLNSAEKHSEAVELLESLVGGAVAALRSIQQPMSRRGPQSVSSERIDWLPNEPFSLQTLQGRIETLQVRLGGQLVEAGEYRESDRRLREWLDETRNPRARFGYLMALVSCHRERGDEAAAMEILEQARLLQPDSPGLNNDVAYGWVDRGIRLEEAEGMIRFTVSRNPRHMAYLDTFGWLLYKKGDFSDSRKWLERALNAEHKKDPVVCDHLGDAMWKLGDRESAIRQWEQARQVVSELSAPHKLNADERRVRDTVQTKIDDARAGREPAVAASGRRDSEIPVPADPRP